MHHIQSIDFFLRENFLIFEAQNELQNYDRKRFKIRCRKNNEYYNNVEGCCWTYEKAYKRIHQVFTMEDSMYMVQMDSNDTITGYLMGYFKEFDDIQRLFSGRNCDIHRLSGKRIRNRLSKKAGRSNS